MQSEPTTAAEVMERARATRRYFASLRPPKPAKAVAPTPAPQRVAEVRHELPPAPPAIKPVVIPYTLACALAQIGRRSVIVGRVEPEDLEVRPAMRDIIEFVADRYGFTTNDIKSHRRTRDVAWARMIGYALCKRLTLHSLPEIARRFGGRDHSSILSGIRRVETLCASSPELKADLEAMCRELAERAKEASHGRLLGSN